MQPVTRRRIELALDQAAASLGLSHAWQRTILRTLADEVVRLQQLDPDEARAAARAAAGPPTGPPAGLWSDEEVTPVVRRP